MFDPFPFGGEGGLAVQAIHSAVEVAVGTAEGGPAQSFAISLAIGSPCPPMVADRARARSLPAPALPGTDIVF